MKTELDGIIFARCKNGTNDRWLQFVEVQGQSLNGKSPG
jgi:hypothetical protein